MKNLLFAIVLYFLINNVNGQTTYPMENGNIEDVDVPPTKALGYTLVGLGTVAIAYTAFKISPESNPALVYSIGGAFILGGLALLIWGDNEGTPKYWKGMQGYVPKNKRENNFNFFSDSLSLKPICSLKQMIYLR